MIRIPEDRFPTGTSIHHVVPSTRIVYAFEPGHASMLPERRRFAKPWNRKRKYERV